MQRVLGLSKHQPAMQRPVVFVSEAEHHSNMLSWKENNCDVEMVPVRLSDGLLDIDVLAKLLSSYSRRSMKIGSFSAASNVTGITFQASGDLFGVWNFSVAECMRSLPYSMTARASQPATYKLLGFAAAD